MANIKARRLKGLWQRRPKAPGGHLAKPEHRGGQI